nr:Dyp-type peroxidase [Actinokineospora enzanensis]
MADRSGEHQDGVVSPAQARTALVAFDVTASDRAGVGAALRAVAQPIPGATVTVAVGASLFDRRFGLTAPQRLVAMPAFRNDVLDPAWCHGDVLVQVGSDQSELIEAALARTVPGLEPRWRISGFHPDGQARNLFGFKEGAGNPAASDEGRHVWVHAGDDEPAWCVGGSYQVVRLFRLAMPIWDAESTARQERVFGRRKDDGAPLGRADEHDEPDYAGDPDGKVLPFDSHIRRANQGDKRILRRSHSYRRAADDVGQIFVSFQRDLDRFETIQQRLAGEALERYVLPFGGGYYFLLPGGDVTRGLLA